MRTPLRAVSIFRKCTIVLIVCGLLSLPGKVFSQEREELESSSSSSREATNPRSGSNTPSGPWGNSAASNIGTTTIIPSTESSIGSNGSGRGVQGTTTGTTTTGGTTIRLRPGATVDGRDPGGNPDVPFDPNMNLCFLAFGIVFSIWVSRKKLVAKVVKVSA